MPAPTQRYYSNVSKIMSLQVALNNATTSIVVDDASGLPGSYPFNIALDYGGASVEIVSITNVAGNVLTGVRGQEDTAATSHAVGAVVAHVATALDFTEAAEHIQDTSDVHGTGPASDVVGTTSSQTLTNKTMSGAVNTFSNIPASAVTGTYNNVTVGQSNAAAAALTITPNVAPGTDIITATYWKMDQDGVTRLIGKSAAADVLRIYDTLGTTIRARVDETGRGFFIGATITGSITATSQTLAIGAVTAGGLVTANAGVTVPSGQTFTMASGSTVTDASTGTYSGTNTFSGTVNMNSVVNFGGSSTITFGNGYTVPSGDTGTFASGATLNLASGSTGTLNGTLSRDSATARMLMDAEMTEVSGAFSATTSASLVDITGVTYTFTVPAGRTATLVVNGALKILNTGGTMATTYAMACVLDGTPVGGEIGTTNVNGSVTTASKTWISEGLAAGSHTVKMQYKRTGGTDASSVQTGTGQAVQVYW